MAPQEVSVASAMAVVIRLGEPISLKEEQRTVLKACHNGTDIFTCLWTSFSTTF